MVAMRTLRPNSSLRIRAYFRGSGFWYMSMDCFRLKGACLHRGLAHAVQKYSVTPVLNERPIPGTAIPHGMPFMLIVVPWPR